MKTFLGLVALVTTTFALDVEFVKQLEAKAKSEIEACAKEVSASSSDVAEMFAHKTPSTRNGKCIFFCFYKIYNILDNDGNFIPDGILKTANLVKEVDPDFSTKMIAMFKNCESTPADTDPCIFAGNIADCVRKQKENLGLSGIGIE